jgi:tetratricopeptide (TPR) repeat protein
MSLSGAFTTMPLTDLFQWLNDSRRSGQLSVNFDYEEEYFLHFREGEIVAVEAEDPRTLDLGRLCMGRGMLDDTDLERAHKAAGASGKPIVDVLVEQFEFPRPRLEEIQREGATELVYSLFLRREGRFHFSSTQPSLLSDGAAPPPLDPPIMVRGVLLEAMRRLDEWHRMVEVFPSEHCLVYALGTDDDMPVLKRLQGRGEPMPISELWAQRSADRYRIYEQLYEAYRKGLVAIDSSVQPPEGATDASTIDVLVKNGEILLGEKQYDEAAAVLRSALSLDPFNAQARDLLHRTREEQLAELYQTLPPYKIPNLRVPRERLDRMSLNDRERQVATRINGRWDVGALALMLPIGELETLRALRKLVQLGAVNFDG